MDSRTSAQGNRFSPVFMLIVCVLILLKVPLVNAKKKIFALLFENNLVLRTNQQSLIKWTWVFSQSVTALTVTNPGA